MKEERVDGECVLRPGTDPDDLVVNKTNGSFSTNYIRTGLQYRRLYPSGEAEDIEELARVTAREWGVGFDLEFNPTGYIGGSIDDDLRELYGPTRVSGGADLAMRNWTTPLGRIGWNVVCGRAEAKISLKYIHNAPEPVSDVATALEASCLPQTWGGTGLFVRFYRGQDYYNLGFFENISRLQFGITFHQGKFLPFSLPALE